MDPITPPGSGANPTNNPRLDLLHNTGDNQQLSGIAGSYGPEPMAQVPNLPQAAATPTAAAPDTPQSASSYVSAAQAARPSTPVPLPAAPTPPQPKPAPPPSAPTTPRSGRPLIVVLVIIMILAAAGGGVWWYLNNHKSQPANQGVAVTPVAPTNLTQTDSTGTSIEKGGTTKQSKVTFHFNVSTSAATGSLTPEVEIEPVDTDFTNQPNLTGQSVNPGGGSMEFSVDTKALTSGNYHWQARTSSGSKSSSWVVYGGDASATAFMVSATAATAPTVTSVGGAAVANPTVVTSNRPIIIGKADPNSTINVSVSPDSQQFTTTADASGNWTLTPSSDIPNGQHQLSITATNGTLTSSPVQVTISVNPATSSDTTPSSGSGSGATTPTTPTTTTPTTSAPKTSSNLAATGDNTHLISLISLAAMVAAVAGIVAVRRRYDSI